MLFLMFQVVCECIFRNKVNKPLVISTAFFLILEFITEKITFVFFNFLLIQISLKAVKILIMLYEGNQNTLSVITVKMVSQNSNRVSLVKL